ncbi:MAG: glycosyltransferase family 2 protein [Lachnospiraceae bacterium]|jgi:glycosyltransferase involved in cell wall biosynthesis|nr:glycosyltransferase family 2 protein [Lachnospiraceae bacterium]
MREITFTVPCYNSEDYMERCIDTLLTADEQVEIIIVDDGSTDRTGEIADNYARNYPEIVQVIHQENGGHGAGVNAGLAQATGKYFKVVDSDDWLDPVELKKLLNKMKQWEKKNITVDLVICNYLYDHFYESKIKRMGYKNVLPENQVCGWGDIGHFRPSQYLVMHSLFYRTEVLKESGVKLPRHTFYVDNIFANQPLPFVKSLCYLNLDLYHYFLGREDQSVNEKVLMQRIDQQIRVTKLVSVCTDLEKLRIKNPKLADYLTRNISIMMAISSIHLLLIGTPEAWKKREMLWNYVKNHDRKLYHTLKRKTVSGFTYLPGRTGAALTIAGYKAARKLYQFN